MSQKSFLDNKKSRKNFPYVGRGGGQPTYGKFHMFCRFYFWKLPLIGHSWLKQLLNQAPPVIISVPEIHDEL